jgi:uncharacterized protein with PQ loop repeat
MVSPIAPKPSPVPPVGCVYHPAMDLTAVLGSVCTVLSVAFVWPQVVRVYRLNTVEGLAPNGTLHGLAASAMWTMYGAARGVGPLVVSNGAIGLALLMIAAAQIRHRTLPVTKLVALAAVVAVVGAGSLAISTTLAGSLAIVIGVTSILPQTLHVSRVVNLSGVSFPMYALITVSTLLWTLYGVLIGDPLLVITNILVSPCALFVAMKAWRSQYGSPALAPELS